jgi:hypothetical protein
MYLSVGLLYARVYDFAVQNPNAGHGREGIYFARADDYRWKDLSKAVAQALYDVGKGHSPEPTTFTPEELEKFGVSVLSVWIAVAVMRLVFSPSNAGLAATLDPRLDVRSSLAGTPS